MGVYRILDAYSLVVSSAVATLLLDVEITSTVKSLEVKHLL